MLLSPQLNMPYIAVISHSGAPLTQPPTFGVMWLFPRVPGDEPGSLKSVYTYLTSQGISSSTAMPLACNSIASFVASCY